jgi:hypothetical protein
MFGWPRSNRFAPSAQRPDDRFPGSFAADEITSSGRWRSWACLLPLPRQRGRGGLVLATASRFIESLQVLKTCIGTMNRRSAALNSLSSSRGGEGRGEEANFLTTLGRFMERRPFISTPPTLNHAPLLKRIDLKVDNARRLGQTSVAPCSGPIDA